MNLRSKLTYANVVATLALVLALGGGTVYAAIKLGKNDVESRNIAPGEVKTSDLGENAVTSPKIKNGGIDSEDLAAGVAQGIIPHVTGSAKAGPKGGINTNTTSPLPLTGKTTFTPGAGAVSALVAEGRYTVASTDPAQFCSPAVFLFVNGEPTRVFVDPDSIDTSSTTPLTGFGRDADGPFGLLNPTAPLTITAQIAGDQDCTAGSRLDRLEIRIVQIR